MASEEVKKKWGTIFMGNREASVEQLKAMQEPLQREQRKKEQAEDYMERVRARAAERAREILGAAYAERQKVLEEARMEANAQKKQILGDCNQKLAEAENVRKLADSELAVAEKNRKEAELLRNKAHDEGYQAGMKQAENELQEFRVELGQALGHLLGALEWQQGEILKNWRDDLVTLVQCAAQAGAAYVLNKEHEAIMRGLVFQALDLLESRRSISIRVNPADEAQVADLFRAARERYPELGQWIVTGDEKIERGGLVAESGSGSVDLKRENFREMVDGVLTHLSLPQGNNEERYAEMIREIVEREATRITMLTPEISYPEQEQEAPVEISPPAEQEHLETEPREAVVEDMPYEISEQPLQEQPAEEVLVPETAVDAQVINSMEEELFSMETFQEDGEGQMEEEALAAPQEVNSSDPALAALEEELFPLDNNVADGDSDDMTKKAPKKDELSSASHKDDLKLEPETLAEGGFL